MEECDALVRMIHSTDIADPNCMYWIQTYSKEGQINLEGLFMSSQKYPYLFLPAINFRSVTRKKLLGEDVWDGIKAAYMSSFQKSL